MARFIAHLFPSDLRYEGWGEAPLRVTPHCFGCPMLATRFVTYHTYHHPVIERECHSHGSTWPFWTVGWREGFP